MKIDLHFHDKRKKGEGQFDLSEEKIIKIIETYNIGILGIVRHDEIDFKKNDSLVNKIKNEKMNSIICLGIEKEFKFYENKIHVIFLFSQEIKKELEETIYEKLLNETNLEEIKKILINYKDEIIISPHATPKSKQIPVNYINKFEEIFDKFLIIYDTTRFDKFLRIINANNRSLIGSDLVDLNDTEKFNRLIEIHSFSFKNLRNFILFMMKDEKIIKKILRDSNYIEKEINNFQLFTTTKSKKEEKYEQLPVDNKINNFKYKKGINLIFGKRATGKTILLHSLNKYFNNESAYYNGNDIEKNFKIYTDKLINDYINEKKKEIILPIFEEHFFTKVEINNTHEFSKKWKSYKSNISATYFNKVSDFINNNRKNDLNEKDWKMKFKIEIKNINTSINLITNFIEKKETISSFNIFLELLKLDIKEKKLEKMKFSWSSEFEKKCYDIIEARRNKQGLLNVPDLDFFAYTKNKLDIYKYFLNLKLKINKVKGKENKEELDQNKFGFGEYKLYVTFNNITSRSQKYLIRKNVNTILSKENILDINNEFDDKLKKDDISLLNTCIEEKSIFAFLEKKFSFEIDKNIRNDLSTGEKKEITLNQFLDSEEEYLLIDEIDSSLDSMFVSQVLVKKLINLENTKTIFLATHNANIAINTMPINWILREEYNGKWKTFYGDHFSEILHNMDDYEDKEDWKLKAIEILEGGEGSFNKRANLWTK